MRFDESIPYEYESPFVKLLYELYRRLEEIDFEEGHDMWCMDSKDFHDLMNLCRDVREIDG